MFSNLLPKKGLQEFYFSVKGQLQLFLWEKNMQDMNVVLDGSTLRQFLKGVSVVDISRETGLARPTIYRAMEDDSDPRLSTARLLSDYCSRHFSVGVAKRKP